MDLKILGCHGGETPKHRTSSFLINDEVAIDAGAITSMLSLEEQRRIRAALISHPHLDHIRDLATIADNRCQQGGPPLEIIGTPETLRELRRHFFNDRLWPDFTKIDTKLGPTIIYRPARPERVIEVCGLSVVPIMVNHTIDTAGFLIDDGERVLAYSGDTGPTERLWEVLSDCDRLAGLLMEVSFPNSMRELAHVSGHLTPQMLKTELGKLRNHAELPIFLYHIKPVFQAKVEKELARIRKRDLHVLRLGDQFLL
ncbi:MAG: 3',5'-cyclic-nucleotide phosphodiesterase [Myxococcales bacterium]|nr:3',5'-cyclic-nucleotide phosphodiesterase [Myxococcales bacterium]